MRDALEAEPIMERQRAGVVGVDGADHDVNPTRPLPDDWIARAAAERPGIPLPIDMSDGTMGPVTFERWDGTLEIPVDRAIQDTRSTIYPLHGLDAHDPRD